MTWDLLNSEAYKTLPSSAAKALPYFLGKHGKGTKTDDYSGTFEFSYAEAKRHGFATRTFSRVIQELVKKGFIDPAGYGGLRGFCKSFNKFMTSKRWERYGTKNFEEKSWKQTET
ncbi:hypothetical protein HXX01_04380 [Candidatus Nomurabacteria bacterium]|nr:hypothetical protein [Candidatus Nomurabacteria bacterium]